jgi:hypothetical protein
MNRTASKKNYKIIKGLNFEYFVEECVAVCGVSKIILCVC